MSMPDKSHQAWRDLVTGKKTYDLKSLAVRMVLGRLTQSVREDPSPANVAACVEHLYDVFSQNAHTPSVQEDLKTIFG